MIEALKSIMNGVFQNFVTNIVNQAISAFANFLTYISNVSLDILKLDMVSNAITYAQALALCVLAIKIIYEALTLYILHVNGESNNPFDLLKGTLLAVGMIMGAPQILNLTAKAGQSIAQGVSSLKGLQKIDMNLNTFNTLFTLQTLSTVVLISIIVAIVFIVLIFIQSFIRTAEMVLLSIMGCIFAMSLTTNGQSFKIWFKETIVVCCSQALQIFMVEGGFYLLVTGLEKHGSAYGIMLFIGWLWVTYKTPAWLKNFVYSSGASKAIGGAVQSGGQMLLMKTIMRGGK